MDSNSAMNPIPNPTASAKRAYFREVGLSGIGYALAAIISLGYAHQFAAPWRFAIAALPIFPVVFFFAATVRYVLTTDELQRRIIVDSAAVAGVATALISFSTIFLGSAGVPNCPAWWSFLVFTTSYVIAIFSVRRHYHRGASAGS